MLLGNPEEIRRVAAQQGVELGAGVEIIDSASVRENYVARLVELRGAKGMTEVVAREKLDDSVFLGTMMLEAGEVDGLVFWCCSHYGEHNRSSVPDHQNGS